MKTMAVASTTLAKVAYHPDRQLLQLEFRDRAVYQYFEVPAEVHQALLRASSKGRYFNLSIRGRYTCARIGSLS